MDREDRSRRDGFGGDQTFVEPAAADAEPYGPRALGATTDPTGPVVGDAAVGAARPSGSASVGLPASAWAALSASPTIQLRSEPGASPPPPAGPSSWRAIVASVGSPARPSASPIQRREQRAARTPAPAAGGSGGGDALPDPVRTKMEGSFGADFSAVRVHQGGEAAALHADAYAEGTDLHFAPGRYDPHSESGQALLGHELGHVVQQAEGRVAATRQMHGAAVNDDPALEREADVWGERAARGEAIARSGGGASGGGPVIQGAKLDHDEFAKETAYDEDRDQEDEQDDELKANRTKTLEAHFGSKVAETKAHRDENQDTLAATDNPASIIANVALQRPDELVPKFAENSIEKDKEDMPYYHHAQMVMGQYNKYFSPQVKREDEASDQRAKPVDHAYDDRGEQTKPAEGGHGVDLDQPIVSDQLMKMMLAFHDIDKQQSIASHGHIGEHTDTVNSMSEFSRDWGFSAAEVRIACEMVGSDPFGDYFKQVGDIKANAKALGGQDKINAELEKARIRCFKTIVRLARNAGVPEPKLLEFFERYFMFYQADFSSYTTDSSYQDELFKPGKIAKPGGEDDEWQGPDSFKPEFFERTGKNKDGGPDQGTPLELADNKKRLHFASGKQLNQAAKDLEDMFQSGKLKGHLDAYAPATSTKAQESTTAVNRRLDRNEAQRSDAEARKSDAQERLDANPYVNVEQPIVVLSRALTKLASKKPLSEVVIELARLTDKDAAKVVDEYQLPLDVAVTVIRACQAIAQTIPRRQVDDGVTGQFQKGGVFIRKLLPEANTNSRAAVDKDATGMLNNVLRQPTTPFVMPSTLVHQGIPTNLTNAQESLQHSSGLIYDQRTRIAPSTKEHNESANLARVLTAPVRGRIHDEETWKSVVRPTISAFGGKSYDSREGLLEKLKEMEARRSGAMPDLSTKELLLEVLAPLDKDTVEDGDFKAALASYLEKQKLPDFIQKQLVHKFKKVQAEKVPKPLDEGGKGKAWDTVDVGTKLKYIRLALDKPREDRDHSIYGGDKNGRGEDTGNRYFRKDKQKTKHGSSEAEGYDGLTFQTNEVLMLPEGVDFIKAIYSNGYSISSRLHSLNLTREVLLQTGNLPGLYNYTAVEGLSKTSVIEVLDEIHARLAKGEELAPPSGLDFGKKKGDEEEASAQAVAKVEKVVEKVVPQPVVTTEPTSGSSEQPQRPKLDLGGLLAARNKLGGKKDEGTTDDDVVLPQTDKPKVTRLDVDKLDDQYANVSAVEAAKKNWMPEMTPNKDRASEEQTAALEPKPTRAPTDLDALGVSSGGKDKDKDKDTKGKDKDKGSSGGSQGNSLAAFREQVPAIERLLNGRALDSWERGLRALGELITQVDRRVGELEPDGSERADFIAGNQPNANYRNLPGANIPAYEMWLFFRELVALRRQHE